MEQADQTLHDFVLNLLSDTQAMSAFEQDPAAVLDHAGLSDISAADVQEVIPLVVDMVPQADALDGVLSQLPLDQVDAGQLGAIQQLQFVTQALNGVPVASTTAAFGNGEVSGLLHLTADGQADAVWGLGELHTPLGDGAASVTGDVEHGLTAAVWDATVAGSGHTTINLPGLDSVPGLAGGLPGLEHLPGLDSLPGLGGGLPSGFSALSDVTDALDGQNLTNATNVVSSLLSGAAEMTTGALANPADLVSALQDPSAAISSLTGAAETYAATAAQALPAPAGAVAGQLVQTASSATSGVVGDVTSQLHTGPLSSVTGSLPTGEVSHALAPVQGIVDSVTGQLGSTGLGDVTGSLSDPTHALGTVSSTVQSTLSTVTGTTSTTTTATSGSVASHSVVGDVTGSTGLGTTLGTDHTDATGLTGDLSHVTDALHLPGL